MTRKIRLAVVVSHPIQYYVPLYRRLTAHPEIELKVFFTWHDGAREIADHGFQKSFKWDIPMTDGYEYEVVPNVAADAGTHRFWGLRNPELAGRVRSWNPDAVHLSGYAWFSHLAALREFHQSGIPVLFRGDSHLLDEPSPTLRSWVKRRLLRRIYSWPRAFLRVGRANRDYYTAIGIDPDRLYPCPHSIDVERFAEPAARLDEEARQWRRELRIPDDAPVLLYAGKFEERKRPAALMEAFREAALPNAVLLMVGDGEQGEKVKGIAAGDPTRFRWLPFQNQSRMPVVYRMGDLFVLPSAWGETWGLGVNESMACGRPVLVSSRVGCVADMVDASCGAVFPADDWPAFAREASRLMQNPAQLRQMGTAAAARAKLFSIEATAAATIDCLRNVLHGGKRAKPRFVCAGFYGRPNFGDELICRAVSEELKSLHPDCRISILTHSKATSVAYTGPDAMLIEGVYPSPRFFLSMAAQIRAIRDADLLVIGGGGLVNDHYSWQAISRFLVPVCFAILHSKPIVFVGLGVAPVRRKWLEQLARFALGQAQGVYCRDADSLKRSSSWLAAGEPAIVAPDLAALVATRFGGLAIDSAAASPIEYVLANFRDDPPIPIGKLVGICRHALRTSPELVLLASEIHDLALYRRMIRDLDEGERARTRIEFPHSLTQAIALIRSATRVIAERLHVNLVAAFAARPLYTIEYEDKVAAQMGRVLGHPARCTIAGLKDTSVEEIFEAKGSIPGSRLAQAEREARAAFAKVINHGLSKPSVLRSGPVRAQAWAHVAWLIAVGAAWSAAALTKRILAGLKNLLR